MMNSVFGGRWSIGRAWATVFPLVVLSGCSGAGSSGNPGQVTPTPTDPPSYQKELDESSKKTLLENKRNPVGPKTGGLPTP